MPLPVLPFRSPPPKVVLTKGFGTDTYDNAVATARTCYNSRIITAEDVRKDEKARALRDRIAQETYAAGHHTTLQHATFQFTLEHVSRQAIWSFLHSHPFYNSEQVSQRYVEVKPGNVVLPALAEPQERIYRAAVEEAMAAYQALIELLTPKVNEEFFRIFPARRRSPEKWALGIKKRAQEVARYVLPIGTFAHLYHTISGVTLHRYHRLCQQLDVPTEVLLLVKAMVAEVSRVDPLFFQHIEDPLPLEQTLEHRALAQLGRLSAGGSKAYLAEFDGALGPYCSKLVDYKVNAESSVAQGVRDVLGAARAELSDEAALEKVLSPKENPYLGEALVLTTVSKLTRALSHAHYTFQKKLSHTADSQDQRHRMTPGSRPVLHAHYLPGVVDVIVPELVEAVPAARERFMLAMERAWKSIEALLDGGVEPQMALYLLPNAFPIRFLESGDLLHLHHKWVHRLCYTAQEEIWRASLEETLQVRKAHPALGRHIQPPCTLRKEAGITPFCPEGPRFCGVPVWKMDLPEFRRLI
ncbi:MAG: FAD-dependent thymidylate synthase [Myxococcota bacterium]